MTVKSMKKRFFRDDGFTLIELLMVVIILGILAAVVIPQFTSSTMDAKISALKSDLAAIRGAIELYSIQHDGQYPGVNFEQQMTLYTNSSGLTQASSTPEYRFGPYLRNGIPENPFASNASTAAKVYVDTATTTIGTIAADPNAYDAGWIFVSNTGEFIANHPTVENY